jgi:glyoxylase I family protein
MPIKGFSHYNFRAEQALLDELRDFYIKVVGLELGFRPPFSSFGYWLYAGPQAVLHLSLASASERHERNVPGTFDHVAFACSDMPGFETRLRKLGIAYETDEVPLTGQRQIFFNDPAGNGVELNFDATS